LYDVEALERNLEQVEDNISLFRSLAKDDASMFMEIAKEEERRDDLLRLIAQEREG
jgi:hypothetical protein